MGLSVLVRGLVIKRFGMGQIFCFTAIESFLTDLSWQLCHLDRVKIESQKLLMYVFDCIFSFYR